MKIFKLFSVYLKGLFYVLIFALIIILFLYDHVDYLSTHSSSIKGARFTEENYIKNPELYGGHKAERLAKIVNISRDHFYIRIGDKDVNVMGSNIKRPTMGESVFFLNYRKDGIIELIDYHNYNYNYLLYSISFIAVILFFIIFFKEWKLTKRGFRDA